MKILIQSAAIEFGYPDESYLEGTIHPVINFKALVSGDGAANLLDAVQAHFNTHHRAYFGGENSGFYVEALNRSVIHDDSLKVVKRFLVIEQDCCRMTEEYIANTYFRRRVEGNYREREVQIQSQVSPGQITQCVVNFEKGNIAVLSVGPTEKGPAAGRKVDLYIEGTVLLPVLETKPDQVTTDGAEAAV